MLSRRLITSIFSALIIAVSLSTTTQAARLAARDNFESKSRVILASYTHVEVAVLDKGCCAKTPKCCYDPCISYRYRGCRRVCCGCEQPKKVILKVVDPQCCCYVNVPVCVPPCCTRPPCVTSRCGLFHRGIIEYKWCCGFKIRVTITKCKDINVTYIGL